MKRRAIEDIRAILGASNLTFASLEDSRLGFRVRVWGMRKGITVNVIGADRAHLRAVVANRNSPQKHVWRAKIILLTAEGLGTNGITRSTGRAESVAGRNVRGGGRGRSAA